ncbi:MAG: gliding motility-associated C-terminal domain-containing protein, partial [Chitinophagaceae bacterium]|nr:gliding motility-associated C-terminal domain-containing protein [Chitinophagaceae bacterium]
LAGNTPTSGTGTWTALAGNPSTVTFTNAADPATTVNGLTTGTYQFVWTISNGLCTDSKDTVSVTVYAATAAGRLVADSFVCVTNNSGMLRLSAYTGSITHWEVSTDSGANWAMVNSQSDSLIYHDLTLNSQYRALVQNGPCISVYSNIVTVNVSPATNPGKLITTQTTVCAAYNNGTLSLNGYTGSILRWELSEDGGNSWSALSGSGNTYSYADLSKASWFRVVVQSGACSIGYSDTVRISVDAITAAGTLAGSATVCAGGNSGTLSLTGTTGHVQHWESSTDNGATWTVLADTNRVFNYNAIAVSTWYRALVQNGVCAVQYSNTIPVTAIQPVTIASAGPDQLLCNADSSTTLTGNTPVSGTGLWTLVKGPDAVQFADATSPSTKVNGLQPGNYQFAWTISNGICVASTSIVNVVVDKIKPVFTLAGRNECAQTIYQFTDSSTAHSGIRMLRWSVTAGDTATGEKYTHIFTREGKYSVSHQALSNAGCVSHSGADFAVKVFEYPRADINAVSEACKKQLLQLTPDVNSRDSIAYLLWNLGNGQKLKDSLIEVQYYEEGAYSVKLLVSTVNQCFDSAYKQIVIHPQPVVTLKGDQNLCKGDSLVLQAGGAANYLWKDAAGNLICANCATPVVRPLDDTHYEVVGVSEYGCSQIATTKIKVIQPFKLDASPEDSICIGSSRSLFASGAASYKWYPEAGLTTPNAAKTIARPQSTTTYHVIGKDNYQCFADTAEIRIVVGQPTKIDIGRDTVMTAGTVLKLRAKPAVQDIKKWLWSGVSGLSCITCAEPELRVSQDATISLVAVNNYGCVSNDTMQIKTFCGSTEVFVPNAFTPDGDGVNDVLVVQGKGIKLIKSFRIFSRWGELVFEKSNFAPGDISAGWDGKIRGVPASPDVFVYMCEVICEKGIPSMFKGNVAIIK